MQQINYLQLRISLAPFAVTMSYIILVLMAVSIGYTVYRYTKNLCWCPAWLKLFDHNITYTYVQLTASSGLLQSLIRTMTITLLIINVMNVNSEGS